MVAGFMASMCGVRVGSIGIAAELDEIGEKLLGIERFTKTDGTPLSKLRILKEIKSYIEKTGFGISGMNGKITMDKINLLMEFCKIVDKKGLEICVWA